MTTVIEELPDLYRLLNLTPGHRTYVRPSIEESLATPLSDDLLFNWVNYLIDNDVRNGRPPAASVEQLAWDLYRRCGNERGYEFFVQLMEQWGCFDFYHEIDPIWAACDRPETADDQYIIHELVSIHHNAEGGLAVLFLPDDGEDLRNEIDALADRFDTLQFEMTKKAGAPHSLNKGTHTNIIRERYNLMEQAQYARDIKSGKVPLPLSSSADPTTTTTISLADFYAYLPMHTYIFTPTREMWPASSVNARVAPVAVPMREKPVLAATWLDANRSVEQMTWAPGKPMEIANKLIADGGWIYRDGCTTFNLYRPPTIKPAEGDAAPWLDHVQYIFGEEADHIVKWFAHRVQFPDQKINHALVLGGPQGIGKDTMIEPIKAAVGPWNFSEVSPQQMLGRFNGFVKSVVLRVSEARDLGDTDRYGFYEHMKTLTAAPPDVLRVDEKHMREHAVLNVCGVIITTNNKDSLHLPSDDRRHFVAWSTRNKDDFPADYWTALYGWFNGGGNEIVAHHLANMDLSGFDAKAPPPKTDAFWEIADASRAPEDAEMADALDKLGRPPAVTLRNVITSSAPDFSDWLRDRKNRRRIPHRMEECGYVPVRNPDVKDGAWVVAGTRQAIYAKQELSLRDRLTAAANITRPISSPA